MTSPTSATTHRRAAVEGAIDSIPLALAIIPFAFTIGAVCVDADVDTLAAWAGSFLLFGGSAQLAAIELLDDGAGVAIAAATALAINARFFVYGPGLARWFASESRVVRALLALPIVDQTYLVCAARFERNDLDARGRRNYYLGVAVPPTIVWVAAQALGVFVGDDLPGADALSLAPALLFAGLLTASVTSASQARAAAIAAVTVLLAATTVGPATLGLGIVVAALFGGRP